MMSNAIIVYTLTDNQRQYCFKNIKKETAIDSSHLSLPAFCINSMCSYNFWHFKAYMSQWIRCDKILPTFRQFHSMRALKSRQLFFIAGSARYTSSVLNCSKIYGINRFYLTCKWCTHDDTILDSATASNGEDIFWTMRLHK